MLHTQFRAVAVNKEGWTFSFSFTHPNWNGARERAIEVMLARDEAKKYGPWELKSFDGGGCVEVR